MSYGGAYPRIKCISLPGTTKDLILSMLYDQNATCQKCGQPFIDDDICVWDGQGRVEHVNCDSPLEPGDALIRGAEERVKRAKPH